MTAEGQRPSGTGFGQFSNGASPSEAASEPANGSASQQDVYFQRTLSGGEIEIIPEEDTVVVSGFLVLPQRQRPYIGGFLIARNRG